MKKNKKLTDKQLFKKAEKGDISILSDRRVGNLCDELNKTPLHCLAIEGKIEVLSHQSIAKIKDNDGLTPLDHFFKRGGIKKKDFIKLFPWYQLKKNKKITKQLVLSVLKRSPQFSY
mgnify:CR=1 FL=1